jgi:hypothetical protein
MGMINPFYNAEAICGDIGAMFAGMEVDRGYAFILAGKEAGELLPFTEFAGGGSNHAEAGFEIGRIDYTRNADDFKGNYIYGERNKVFIGAGEGFGGGIGLAWGKVPKNRGNIITTTISAGFSISPVFLNAGFNNGEIKW